MESVDQQLSHMLARMSALEQEVHCLTREKNRLERLVASPEQMNRRQLFMGGASVLGAALGGAILGHATTAAASTLPTTTVNYQGRLSDSNGPVNSTVAMTFALYNVLTSGQGTQLWSESQNVNVQNGLFSVYLGASTPLPVNLLSQTLYLDITVSGQEMTSREPLSSGPYALLGQPGGIATLDVNSHVAQAGIRQLITYSVPNDLWVDANHQGAAGSTNYSYWLHLFDIPILIGTGSSILVTATGMAYNNLSSGNWVRLACAVDGNMVQGLGYAATANGSTNMQSVSGGNAYFGGLSSGTHQVNMLACAGGGGSMQSAGFLPTSHPVESYLTVVVYEYS